MSIWEELKYKYQNEIHANELVLLAYYIAAINIESVYHDLVSEKGDKEYVPFNGICLTDTFQLYEKDDLVSALMVDNSTRRSKQKKLDIRVIIGNPPYSAGQDNTNDNNANVEYPLLDSKIRSTYAARSNATNKNALYDSYIRAIRWASDRIMDAGVIGFVSNAGFIETNTADGLRKCLAEEFSSIYVFHLRGNARTSGELRRREKDNVFGQGTRTPVSITLMVKNPKAAEHGKIFFHDIGDYLTRDEKLTKITDFISINGITAANGWTSINPDQHGDWISQRDDTFSEYISLGDKKDKDAVALFKNYSNGIKTNRDAWCYNYSPTKLALNMGRMIDLYNSEVTRYHNACKDLAKDRYPDIDSFINSDSTKISWNRGLKNDLRRNVKHSFQQSSLVTGMYRPFTKIAVYFSKHMNDMVYQMPRIFPNSTVDNRVISLVGLGTPKSFSVIMTNVLPDLQLQANGQCFPLKLYSVNNEPAEGDESEEVMQISLLDDAPQESKAEGQYCVTDGLTDEGLDHFNKFYKTDALTKEDIFYYIYGLLHSEDYKSRFEDNLTKELPRIPCVKKLPDFWLISNAGRSLADLHLNYEAVAPYQVKFNGGKMGVDMLQDEDFKVTQMKFPSKLNKTSVIYNSKITMTDIPLEAYDYQVNGKSALEWVMERQSITTHKESRIVNDANDWAIDTMQNPRYPLELFQRVITVSLETMKIVRALPKLEI